MMRHRVCGTAVLFAAGLLLSAAAPASAQVSIGAPFYAGAPSPYGYSAYPYGTGGMSWPGAYSYTQRYYWYGYNWPYPGYFTGKYHGMPLIPRDAASTSEQSTRSPSSDRTSSYSYGAPSRTDADTARLNVRVPDGDAEVWVEGKLTQRKGTRREFLSPQLDPAKNYKYEVRARWTENGRAVERTRTVPVRANGTATVDFTAADEGRGGRE